jgi:signal transduction histidine kinase
VNIIAGVIVFGFALSAIGGWILVGRTLQPISEIVAEASKMSGNRLEPAFVAARTLADDEIGDLVTALNQMMSRVQAAIECQRQFTADASHDLKTPLAILRGEMELALDRDRSIDEYRGVLVSGLEETERLIRIVSDLRELANADLDQVSSVRRSECDLVDLAANVVDSRTHYAIMRNVSLKMIESKGMHKIVMWVDPVAIERAIANLVDNAIHYNRSPGQVKVYVQKEDDAAVLKVYDTGIGIDESDKEFIFDRFYRGDKSRSKTGLNDRSNSGLGLAIVKSIVTSHGGSVKVESKVGDGSTFTIRLPMEQPAARQATEAMRKV